MQQQGSGESEPDIDDPRLAGIPKAMRRMFLAQLADQMKQESRQPVCMCTCMWIHVCMRAVTAASAAAAFWLIGCGRTAGQKCKGLDYSDESCLVLRLMLPKTLNHDTLPAVGLPFQGYTFVVSMRHEQSWCIQF